MKKVIKTGWVIICVFVFAAYLVSCLTPFINPQHFSFISIFALSFPFIFLAAFICCLTLLFIQKKTALFLLCVIFIGGFKNLSNTIALNTGKWEMKKDTGSVRIMTWNVEDFVNLYRQNYSGAKPRIEMLKKIHEYNPDILCLQEYRYFKGAISDVFASPSEELDSLGYIYSYTSNDSIFKQYFPTVIFEGSAIYSRIPLIDSNRINITKERKNENLIYTDILLHNKRLRIFTGHLLSLGLYSDTAKEGTNKNIYEVTFERKHWIEYKIREAEIEHNKEVAIIRDAIAKSPYPVIYCGDINSTPATYTYNKLRGNLQDAFLEKGFGLGGTFYKLPSTIRIDVCLPDKKFKVQQCTVPQLYLSDHFPVVTDVTWR